MQDLILMLIYQVHKNIEAKYVSTNFH